MRGFRTFRCVFRGARCLASVPAALTPRAATDMDRHQEPHPPPAAADRQPPEPQLRAKRRRLMAAQQSRGRRRARRAARSPARLARADAAAAAVAAGPHARACERAVAHTRACPSPARTHTAARAPGHRAPTQPSHNRKPQAVFTAARDISPGEELTITYTDCSQGVRERRAHLSVSYGFDCRCPLCLEQLGSPGGGAGAGAGDAGAAGAGAARQSGRE